MKKYIYEEDEIVCNFMNCAGGMGIAGNGKCFLNGDATLKDCKEFVLDEDFQEEQKSNAGKGE